MGRSIAPSGLGSPGSTGRRIHFAAGVQKSARPFFTKNKPAEPMHPEPPNLEGEYCECCEIFGPLAREGAEKDQR
ncbi:MAG: hypothetical protein CL678_02295 [Bdellovibrionaceae bacterium]|nr:hypothetical protein [Pseudobdellovibrionaceae bacterium]